MGRRRSGLKIAGLVGLVLLFALVVSELSRSYLAGAAEQQFRDLHGYYTPPFHRGDPAPDFTLPDTAGKQHSLQSLVHGNTVLCFICGCDRCRTMQIRLGKMLRSLGPRAPNVVTVSAAPPDGDAAWRRDTQLKQTILYDSKAKGKPIIQEYRGDPCPRLFGLDADRRVTWMTPSPAQVASLDALGEIVARNLGYRIPAGFAHEKVTAQVPSGR